MDLEHPYDLCFGKNKRSSRTFVEESKNGVKRMSFRKDFQSNYQVLPSTKFSAHLLVHFLKPGKRSCRMTPDRVILQLQHSGSAQLLKSVLKIICINFPD